MKIGRVATVSVLATAKAHASRRKAVGVATKTRIFMKVLHAPMGALRMMRIPSDGGEGSGDGGRRAPRVGLNPNSVASNPPRRTTGHEALSKFHPLQGRAFSREYPQPQLFRRFHRVVLVRILKDENPVVLGSVGWWNKFPDPPVSVGADGGPGSFSRLIPLGLEVRYR